ncbi:MAG: hypothetical protein AAGI63_19575 [Planctomycetota bacterium]
MVSLFVIAGQGASADELAIQSSSTNPGGASQTEIRIKGNRTRFSVTSTFRSGEVVLDLANVPRSGDPRIPFKSLGTLRAGQVAFRLSSGASLRAWRNPVKLNDGRTRVWLEFRGVDRNAIRNGAIELYQGRRIDRDPFKLVR